MMHVLEISLSAERPLAFLPLADPLLKIAERFSYVVVIARA
jgi:hypothetical protein